MTCLLLPLPISIHSLPGLMVSASVASGSSAVAHLVEVGDRAGACRGARVPRSGSSSPRISLSSVVLPAPLGPIRPTLSPRRMVALKSSIDALVAEALADVLELGDELAAGGAGVDVEPHLAERRRAAPRAARAAPRGGAMRPTLRVRRASTPLRIQTSSCASSLSARALPSASASSSRALRCLVGGEVARIAAQPAAVQLDDARRDRVEEGAVVRDQQQRCRESRFSSSSSQAMASRSRWLVGSSSSSTSGAATSACASATRFFMPPDSVPTTRAPIEVRAGAGSSRRAAPSSSRRAPRCASAARRGRRLGACAS